MWFAAGWSGSKRSRTSAQLCSMLAWCALGHGGVAVPRQWRPSAGRTGPLVRGIFPSAVTLVARIVAPAPFDATPDGPTCAAELSAHQPRSSSLPRDQFDQYCEVRLAAKVNDDTHKSMLSCLGSWLRGRPGARLSFPDDH